MNDFWRASPGPLVFIAKEEREGRRERRRGRKREERRDGGRLAV